MPTVVEEFGKPEKWRKCVNYRCCKCKGQAMRHIEIQGLWCCPKCDYVTRDISNRFYEIKARRIRFSEKGLFSTISPKGRWRESDEITQGILNYDQIATDPNYGKK